MTTVERVIQDIVRGGLMSARDVSLFRQQLDNDPQDAVAFAEALVRAEKLTRYQQTCVLNSRVELLRLGRYLILDKLGEGGMGVVYRARHRHMNRLVALKVLSRKLLRNSELLDRFRREVEMAARLQHPNIVTAFDADVVGKSHFLVMEFVDGPNLRAYVHRRGPLSTRLALHFLLRAARGLEYAHGRGVVHRDIKPSNLLISREGTLKIADMGLARFIERSNPHREELTCPGDILGTLEYMAPEQAMNIRDSDVRSDIYSLGCTLHYLLTGEPIFRCESSPELLLAHRLQPAPDLTQRCSDLPVAVNELFQRMVAKRAEDRYQTMRDVVVALEQLQPASRRSPAVADDSGCGELATFLQSLGHPANLRISTVTADETDRSPVLSDRTRPVSSARGPAPASRGPAPASRGPAVKSGRGAAQVPGGPDRASALGRTGGPRAERRLATRRRRSVTHWLAIGLAILTVAASLLLWPRSDLRPVLLSWLRPAATASSRSATAGPVGDAVPRPPAGSQPAIVTNYALRFDGNSSLVSVPTLHFNPRTPLTVEAWVRPTSSSSPAVSTCLGWHGTAWISYCGLSRVLGAHVAPPRGDWAQLHSPRISEASGFMHVAFVLDDGYLSFFVNGRRQERRIMVSHLEDLKTVDPFTIGSGRQLPEPVQGPATGGHFAGWIDEIRVSNTARYRENRFVPARRFQLDRHTESLFHCDEGQGAVLHDQSPHGHLGVLTNVQWEALD